jgi:predicted O-methyltransferase YrrM
MAGRGIVRRPRIFYKVSTMPSLSSYPIRGARRVARFATSGSIRLLKHAGRLGSVGFRLTERHLMYELWGDPPPAGSFVGVSGVYGPRGMTNPSERLLDLSAKLFESARHAPSPLLPDRPVPDSFDYWPGEHYRLLYALAVVVKPRYVVEIGTLTGLSALSMLRGLDSDAHLVTIDILPWDSFPDTVLTAQDFADGRLRQLVGDLTKSEFLASNANLLAAADLIFIDGPKDGKFEPELYRVFEQVGLKEHCLLVYDDIRLWHMLKFWKSIQRPKMDFTSLGHWTGTGLVDWTIPR